MNILGKYLTQENLCKQIKDDIRCKLYVAFLRVADANEELDPELQVWVKQVREVAHDTEDVLDEFILRLAHHHGDGFYGFLRKISCSIKNLKARHQTGSEIRKIKSKVEIIHQRYQGYHDRFSISEHGSSSTIVNSNTWYDSRGDALLLEEAELVGMDGRKKELTGWLVEDTPKLKVVSVVGMGGLGKTTLVKKVYDDMKVKNHAWNVWITVCQSFDLRELLKNII
ncbi:putative disease resistance protein At1g50180 [Cornus florida]|uniref:putative disease resistance protein At1g50180 n=1 Tax=Cornus florida TaxID=4283 RepID=UPI0028A1CA51|nr:putative disease resistance protein At1g50180 [Cornus florida]